MSHVKVGRPRQEGVKSLISPPQKKFLLEASLCWFPAFLPNALFLLIGSRIPGAAFSLSLTYFLPFSLWHSPHCTVCSNRSPSLWVITFQSGPFIFKCTGWCCSRCEHTRHFGWPFLVFTGFYHQRSPGVNFEIVLRAARNNQVHSPLCCQVTWLCMMAHLHNQ